MIDRPVLIFSALGRCLPLALSLFALMGKPVQAGETAKALWFPDQPNAPRYAWSYAPCEACERIEPYPGWRLMAEMAGLRDIRFLIAADEDSGSAYSAAPNVLVLAPSALGLDTCQQAFVVGHEIAHLAQRHFDEDARLLSALSGKAAGWTRNGERAMGLLDGNIALAFRMSQHWRWQEREADWLGALLAAEVYGCRLEDGALPYLRAAEGLGGGIAAAHDPSARRAEFLDAFAESARRLAFHAYYFER